MRKLGARRFQNESSQIIGVRTKETSFRETSRKQPARLRQAILPGSDTEPGVNRLLPVVTVTHKWQPGDKIRRHQVRDETRSAVEKYPNSCVERTVFQHGGGSKDDSDKALAALTDLGFTHKFHVTRNLSDFHQRSATTGALVAAASILARFPCSTATCVQRVPPPPGCRNRKKNRITGIRFFK